MILGGVVVPHPPLIVHEIGRGDEEHISKTKNSYIKISEEIAKLKPDTIIFSSPHAPLYRDGFYLADGNIAEGDFSDFRAPHVSFIRSIDQELVQSIFSLVVKL